MPRCNLLCFGMEITHLFVLLRRR